MNHHAFLIYAKTVTVEVIPAEFRQQTADIAHLLVDKFGIDEARNLTNQSAQTAMSKAGRVFVILTNSLTVQAQNALLKLFEEPPQGVTFFLVLPKGTYLIPTLLSRLAIQEVEEDVTNNELFLDFKNSAYKDRLQLIAEKTKAKDQIWMEAIFTGALNLAANDSELIFKKSALLANEYANFPGASKKMLLEEIALSL